MKTNLIPALPATFLLHLFLFTLYLGPEETIIRTSTLSLQSDSGSSKKVTFLWEGLILFTQIMINTMLLSNHSTTKD